MSPAGPAARPQVSQSMTVRSSLTRELGEYNPARAIETGQVAEEWKVWQATVRMPVESAFQWGWCTMTVDGRLRRWESMSGRRERQISCYSGTLHTEYGDTGLEVGVMSKTLDGQRQRG
nr:hypothetical protein BaRGS_033566 [Batillaria attramentaria]